MDGGTRRIVNGHLIADQEPMVEDNGDGTWTATAARAGARYESTFNSEAAAAEALQKWLRGS